MADTIGLQASDDGRRVAARVGDEVVVTLEENATTGYRWVATGAGEVLTVVADGYATSPSEPVPEPGATPAEPVVGQGGNREFRFAATSRGTVALVLTLKHEWEDDSTGIARWTVSVDVT